MDSLTAYRHEQARQLLIRRMGEDRRKRLQDCLVGWQERRTGDRRASV